ncbi:hypothetical protein CHLNCDRAFT_14449, partial [Chlorella variabilis]
SIQLKRAYEAATPGDGRRVLVDALWPRGIKKEALPLQTWSKGVAPSTELRKWFHAHADEWQQFRQRYWVELEAEAWQPLVEDARGAKLTLVYGAKVTQHDNAVALQQYLQRKLAAAA